jgi:hypothetical protein
VIQPLVQKIPYGARLPSPGKILLAKHHGDDEEDVLAAAVMKRVIGARACIRPWCQLHGVLRFRGPKNVESQRFWILFVVVKFRVDKKDWLSFCALPPCVAHT